MKAINLHHVGIWVDDMDEMLNFLTEVMGFTLLWRGSRGERGPGESARVHAGDNQLFEIITEPNVQPRPDFPVHPIGHVAGIAHICFRVTNIPAWDEKIQSLGYPITLRAPEQGFTNSMLGCQRALLFTGPSEVGFELVEFKEEFSFDKIGTGPVK